MGCILLKANELMQISKIIPDKGGNGRDGEVFLNDKFVSVKQGNADHHDHLGFIKISCCNFRCT